jgi:hypothetical protein
VEETVGHGKKHHPDFTFSTFKKSKIPDVHVTLGIDYNPSNGTWAVVAVIISFQKNTFLF